MRAFPRRVRSDLSFLKLFAGTLCVTLALQAAAWADDLRSIRIFAPSGSWTGGFELLTVAEAEGFFRKHRLRADWQHLPWDQYTVALQGGALDFAPYADYAYFINVFDKGVKAKEVVSSTVLFDPRNADDLAQRIPASPAPGSPSTGLAAPVSPRTT
jgi:ABC-type nitrate/sulfonate/bicarbonate transport system substrate-binding protein